MLADNLNIGTNISNLRAGTPIGACSLAIQSPVIGLSAVQQTIVVQSFTVASPSFWSPSFQQSVRIAAHSLIDGAPSLSTQQISRAQQLGALPFVDDAPIVGHP